MRLSFLDVLTYGLRGAVLLFLVFTIVKANQPVITTPIEIR